MTTEPISPQVWSPFAARWATDKMNGLMGPFIFAAISYLERNDFRSIRQVGPHTLRASDGETPVYIWLTIDTTEVRIPTVLIDLASTSNARIDVINFTISDTGQAKIKHHMNVEVR